MNPIDRILVWSQPVIGLLLLVVVVVDMVGRRIPGPIVFSEPNLQELFAFPALTFIAPGLVVSLGVNFAVSRRRARLRPIERTLLLLEYGTASLLGMVCLPWMATATALTLPIAGAFILATAGLVFLAFQVLLRFVEGNAGATNPAR